MTESDKPNKVVNYGGAPFGGASPHISAAAFFSVILFVLNLNSIASAWGLDNEDIRTVILGITFGGAFIGFSATWESDPKTKSLGGTYCVLNLLVFLAYGALYLLYAYGRK